MSILIIALPRTGSSELIRRLSDKHKLNSVFEPFNPSVGLPPITDFENLQFRFSVEAVNKDFYKEIAEHFYELVGRYGDKKEVLKKPVLKLPNKKATIEDLQNYSVRLLGRIIFLWFLKQKTSNTGKPLLPTDLLTKKDGNYKNILHDKVEPIFL